MEPKARKRAEEFLEFLEALRARYPADTRIHLVLDNLSTHKTRAVRAYCRRKKITLVFTATNASWMNRIECHFAPFSYFVIKNSDHPDHAAIAEAAQDYLRWRNADSKNQKILKAQNSISTL